MMNRMQAMQAVIVYSISISMAQTNKAQQKYK